MPTKLILIALIFLLISLYLVIVTDMYVLSPVRKQDEMINIQTLDSQKLTEATRNDLIIIQSGERFAVSADTSVAFRQQVPITVYYTPILHKPLSVDFIQDETMQHIDTLYLSRSYNIYSALFILAILQVIYLLRWSKGKSSKEVYLYASVLLFAFLLGFQYLR